MPGSSPTMARHCPVIRLNRVDLPKLGRPTMTIMGISRHKFRDIKGRADVSKVDIRFSIVLVGVEYFDEYQYWMRPGPPAYICGSRCSSNPHPAGGSNWSHRGPIQVCVQRVRHRRTLRPRKRSGRNALCCIRFAIPHVCRRYANGQAPDRQGAALPAAREPDLRSL